MSLREHAYDPAGTYKSWSQHCLLEVMNEIARWASGVANSSCSQNKSCDSTSLTKRKVKVRNVRTGQRKRNRFLS